MKRREVLTVRIVFGAVLEVLCVAILLCTSAIENGFYCCILTLGIAVGGILVLDGVHRDINGKSNNTVEEMKGYTVVKLPDGRRRVLPVVHDNKKKR